jgi:ribonucleoside-diphosphate reductase alpha chain
MIITDEIKKYFRNDAYGYFVFLRTYSRWRDDLNRRESWEEVVQRYVDFMKENLGKKLTEEEYSEVQNAILNQEVMPSMRLLWSSGDAARKNPATAYNCSFMVMDNLKRFRELMFLLMSGCGVGYSVENEFVCKLPVIERQTGHKLESFVIPDSREGWADAIHVGITAWFDGTDVEFDFSKIRPLGARLKTFGGRSSGPVPLRDCLAFLRTLIMTAQGRQLRPIEVHDMCTKIAEVVVAGGSRRSSEISLSDLHDEEMRLAKFGSFHEQFGHRVMANNSVAYKVKPTQQEFMKEWLSLMQSGSGERGIFNREGSVLHMPARRRDISDDTVKRSFGVNPCSEIILRSCQFCNLTSVVCRQEDTAKSLLEKVRIATILGTYQSSLTEFTYLTKPWRDNCDEERLLGVSLNGQLDCPVVRESLLLQEMKALAIKVNEEYAKKMKIKTSTAITCSKPEGTGSQMLGCSSGAHPRYAEYYIRRVRIASSDPLFMMLRDSGVPVHPENGQVAATANTWVLDFPIKSPEGAITRHKFNAMEQLDYWKTLRQNYAEHTISMTVYVAKDEWLRVASWVWDNWDIITGVSFLPKEDEEHIYELAPYEEITAEKYTELMSNFPAIDFDMLVQYEQDDNTEGAQTLACVGNLCEVDIDPELKARLMAKIS